VSSVAIGVGACVLGSGVASGTPITSLTVSPTPSTMTLYAGTVLVIIYQTYYDFVTLSATAYPGATSLAITSWTPGFSFPGGSGLASMPALTDTGLQQELYRFPVAAGVAGASPGETLISGYGDPNGVPSGAYFEVGYFGGPTATSSPGSGVLIARGVVWWAHTSGQDAGMYQLDGQI
jgi:hypothetical protein